MFQNGTEINNHCGFLDLIAIKACLEVIQGACHMLCLIIQSLSNKSKNNANHGAFHVFWTEATAIKKQPADAILFPIVLHSRTVIPITGENKTTVYIVICLMQRSQGQMSSLLSPTKTWQWALDVQEKQFIFTNKASNADNLKKLQGILH